MKINFKLLLPLKSIELKYYLFDSVTHNTYFKILKWVTAICIYYLIFYEVYDFIKKNNNPIKYNGFYT